MSPQLPPRFYCLFPRLNCPLCQRSKTKNLHVVQGLFISFCCLFCFDKTLSSFSLRLFTFAKTISLVSQIFSF
ncbi:hypothetical protein CsSME_00025752 [Camellia sinensis var. sinensis]